MKSNQPEIKSYDHIIFNTRRHQLFNRCLLRSRAKNLNCVIGLPRLDSLNNLEERTLFVWQFDLLCRVKKLECMNQSLAETGREIYIITDNVGTVPKFSNIQIFQRPEMMGVYAPVDNHPPEIINPNKFFNCFMQRVDSVRQTWFYFLHHHKLIDQGYVSFLLKQLSDYSLLTGKELFDSIHARYDLGKLPHFESAYQHWKHHVPFTNFTEQHNLPALYCDSKYSVVLETYATDDDCEFRVFNEKAIRVLQMPTIPLLFVQQNGIALLKQLGFDVGTYNWAFDHLPWQQRQQHILNILIENSIAYDKDLLYNQVIHNRELVTKFAEKCAKLDFFDEIIDQI